MYTTEVIQGKRGLRWTRTDYSGGSSGSDSSNGSSGSVASICFGGSQWYHDIPMVNSDKYLLIILLSV